MDALTSEVASLQQSIERIAEQYDELPYHSRPFAASQPARIAGLARLMGLEPPPIETARVLELGCASGGNLIPHALFHPKAQFVGVDLGKRQVEDANARIARLGLGNIDIRHMSLTDVDEQFGQFDYIISHGVYSWVPAPVRDALMRVCRERLTPNGVAYVSYNVLPGWRLNQPLRDAFRLLIPAELPPLARVGMARDLVSFFSTNTVDLSPFGAVLRNAPERFASYTDDYIFHEYMEEANQPVAFSEFAEHAHRNGLAFLAECDIETMFADNFRRGLAQTIRDKTTGDLVTSEQLTDFLTGRTFRQTLLVATENSAGIETAISPDRMASLHFIAQQGMRLEANGGACRLAGAKGSTMNSNEPAVGRAMQVLLARHPQTTSLKDCTAGMNERERTAVADALVRMVTAGILGISSAPLRAGKAGARPLASRLARDDAAEGAQTTTNRRHEAVQIDAAAAVILPALDGTTERAKLAQMLAEAAIDGRIKFERGGQAERDPQRLKAIAREVLPKVLDGIARSGLLEP